MSPFSGNGAIRAMADGDFQATIYPGTQAGYNAAVAAMGSAGVVIVGPGADAGLSFGTVPSGVVVLVETGDGLRIVGTNAAIYLRDAVLNGNGATDPTIYSDKTLDLSTATSAQAAKSADIKSKFTGTSAFTNLSLNGMHVINQYGASGSGGGDFNTGIAMGAYSEHRGNAAITGSLYGAENASTMYNTGSAANLFGSLNTAQITSGSTSTVTTLRGMQALARVAGTGAGTVTTAVAVEGVASFSDTSSGTMTDAIGGRFSVTKAGGSSGTITAATAVTVASPTAGGTNNFGLRVTGTPSGGSNLNQALRVDSGPTFLGGTLAVGGQGASLIIQSILCATASLNFDLTAVVSQDLTITVTGAASGDPVFLGVPNGSVTADTGFFAWCSAADTVTVRAFRLAGTPNPASGTFRATVFHY